MKCLNKSNLCGIVFPHGTIIIPRKEFDQVPLTTHKLSKHVLNYILIHIRHKISSKTS